MESLYMSVEYLDSGRERFSGSSGVMLPLGIG